MSVESSGELNLDDPGVPNRIQELGAEYFQALSLPITYYGSDEAYFIRQEMYRGMPHGLTIAEVETLSGFVGQQAVERGIKHPERLEKTMLSWLGKTSMYKKDDETAISVMAVIASRQDKKQSRWRFGHRP
jgi:hypothetical protein